MSKSKPGRGLRRGRFLRESDRTLNDFLAGFEEATLRVDLPRIRRHWRLFLDRGRVVLLDRVMDRIEALSPDAHLEERAIACVEQSYGAMLVAFERIETFSFLSAEGFLATLRLHAEIALEERLELFGPWELGRPLELPPFRLIDPRNASACVST